MDKKIFDSLLVNGWRYEETFPSFESLIKEPNYTLTVFTEFLAELGEHTKDNIFGIFGKDVKKAYRNAINQFNPNNNKELVRNLPALYGWNKIDKDDSIYHQSVGLLTYQTILKICEKFGTPNRVAQDLASETLVLNLDRWTSVKDLKIYETGWVYYDCGVLKIEYQYYDMSYHYTMFFYDTKSMVESIDSVAGGLAVNLRKSGFDIGYASPEYKLESFPDYIKDYTNIVKSEMFKDGLPASYNLLVEGDVGTGKTRWCMAFATEVLAPLGYIIWILDYSSLSEFSLPENYEKVCVIINDADTLCLDRELSKRGETEKTLDWLDNTRTQFIKSLNQLGNTSVINLINANSTKKWDSAGLRKGRIDKHIYFEQSMV